MAFTDKDLKQLIATVESIQEIDGRRSVWLRGGTLVGVIERLQASEVRANTWAMNANHKCLGATCACCVADAAWREAAGK